VPALRRYHQCNGTGCQVLGGAKIMALIIFIKLLPKFWCLLYLFLKNLQNYEKHNRFEDIFSREEAKRRLALVTVFARAGSGYIDIF